MVAVVYGFTILRKIHIGDDGYIFVPMNSKYDCIFCDNYIIIGRVVGLYRKIENEPYIKENESNIAGLVPCFDARPDLEYEENCEQKRTNKGQVEQIYYIEKNKKPSKT